jgi:uncharacterized membrane protein YccF (DUF307 family)
MSFIGNILWLIFGGLLSSLGYLLGGVLFCCTIIGIPFGLQSFRMAGAVLAPFGKSIVTVPGESGTLGLIFNILWLMLCGWEIAMVHLGAAFICGITIIGIPFAIQHIKLIPIALLPFGHSLERQS